MKKLSIIAVLFVQMTWGALKGQQKNEQGEKGVQHPPSPIPVETFASKEGLNFQVVFNKKIVQNGKWDFFNLLQYYGDYKNNLQKNQFVSQALVGYTIWNGISINAGTSMVHASGLSPTAGVRYLNAGREHLFVLLPRMNLTQSHNVEVFGLAEFSPKLSKDWGLYFRLQGIYNHNTEMDFHSRSYLYSRVGVSFNQFQWGVGLNLDSYGPSKINEANFGLFARVLLF